MFVSGNHDSDTTTRLLARDGALVLTQFGRLKPDGGFGDVINEVDGLRVAGYADPFERRAADGYRDRFTNEVTPEQKATFADWLRPLIGKVDVVLVHEPALIEDALAELQADPPRDHLVFLVGHTHTASLTRQPNVDVINGGSIGGGGTGNLIDGETDVGLARMSWDTVAGRFIPLSTDLVEIDPGTGAATARRERLDVPAPESG